jgi:hypothetical protein
MDLRRTVKRYRDAAAEYWRRAEAARQPSEKAEYREIAQSYEKRADEIENADRAKPTRQTPR